MKQPRSQPSIDKHIDVGDISNSAAVAIGHGASDEVRRLILDRFYIDRYPITNAEYALFLKEHLELTAPDHWIRGSIPKGRENHPVVYIAWSYAKAYADWANKRLLFEAEKGCTRWHFS